MILTQIIVANLLVSVVSLIGVFILAFGFLKNTGTTTGLVSFAAGVLLATSIITILPEAFEGLEINTVLLWFMIGVIFSFMFERTLLWYHHHHEEDHDVKPAKSLIIFGDGIHNFIDGLAIAAAFIVSPALGVTTTIAIVAHEIPQELADYTVLRHSGLDRNKALMWNFFSAILAILGGILGYYIFTNSAILVYYALAFSAGILLYVSLADLIPELHRTGVGSGWLKQSVIFLAGVLVLYFVGSYFDHEHEAHEVEHHIEAETHFVE